MPTRPPLPRVAAQVLAARSLRGLVDGLISVVLASYLQHLGFDTWRIGVIITATLLGSALFTLLVGLAGHRIELRRVLLGACLLMIGTGVGFATFTSFATLL